MDFGVVGLDSLVCPNSENAATNSGFISVNAAEVTKYNWSGSDFLKQDGTLNEGDLRDLKVVKTLFCGQEMLKIPLQRSDRSSNLTEGQQMLGFSSSSNSQNVTFPYYCHTSSIPFSRNTGNVSGGLNASNMHVLLAGTGAPFTPSQWMELEHQALIYKYITANVPIPSYLLNPIRKAIEHAGFYNLSRLKPNSLEWNAFHLRFSNTDPEPGRCRRTDGKKWRCSKDVVADQKYCERHMNRGRHRSRKPVEGQPGHSASTITTTNGKLTPVTSPTFSSVVAAGGVSNSLSGMPDINRSLQGKEKSDKAYQNMTGLSSKINVKDNQYSIPKHQTAYEESSQPEFGFVCNDSLLNPLKRSSSFMNCRNFSISNHPNDHENKSPHSLRLFTDDWPKNQSENSAISCPNSDLQPDRTQLSISIPMVTSNFMSSTSSPMNEKASPLRLSREHKVTQVEIGVGSVATEHRYRQTNGVPISWELSMGGPLAEVLYLKNNSTSDCKNTKALHLMEGWDNSHQKVSSPTGVLQMGGCGSVTSSSTCGSPRGKSSKSLNGISLRNNGLVNPSLPAL